MLGGQPGNSNSILPKINSFLVNTFFQSGSSNTAQIHPLQPGAIANSTLGPSPKIAKKQPSKRKNSVGIVDTAENVGVVGAGMPIRKNHHLTLTEMPVTSCSTISSRSTTSDK